MASVAGFRARFAEVGTTGRLFAGLFAAVLLLATGSIQAANGAALTSMDFASLPGDRVEIRLQFDNTPPSPKAYTIEKPARIAIDLPGVRSELTEKYHNLGQGNARSVTVVEAPDRTRVVVSLTELVGYGTRAEGNTLYILVGDSASGRSVATRPSGSTGTTAPRSTASRVKGIQDIDFRRGPAGEGKVIVQLSDSSIAADLSEESGRIRVAFPDAQLPEQLRRRLDVKDFATPVQFVDALISGGRPVISVEPTGFYDYLAYQADNIFVIDVKPLTQTEAEQARSERFPYSGDKLSLNFQDIEVRSVLQLIADFTGLNMVASDTVSGRITLRLQNVPWDQALDLVLKTKGLDKRQVGNVLLVAPADEIAAREKLELENSKQIQELAPLRTEFIPVRYAKASEIAALLGGGQGLMSERGSISVDSRTNTLLIQDTSEKLEEIRRALKVLDVSVRQVQVEARVVVADASFADDIGVRWGGLTLGTFFGEGTRYQLGGNLSTVQTLRATGRTEPVQIGTATAKPADLLVDLAATPAAGRASTISVGLFKDNGLLEFELSALQSNGRGEVVAQPKVITADRVTAKIESGTEIPYQEASSSGATATSFKNAVLGLEVTPQITPDNRIIMDLVVNQDSVGDVFQGVPSIDTNSVETQVIVNNGETVVLGGVFTTTARKDTVKTPFLGDLPYIGRLFRRESVIDNKLELLIFVTPKLIEDALATR